MRRASLLIAALLVAAPAFAEDYEKGPNGGLMLDVAGIDAELMTAGITVKINVFVPFTDKPVSTKASPRRCSSSMAITARRSPLLLRAKTRCRQMRKLR